MKLNFQINYKLFYDKKSLCWIAYSKKYNITGYGTKKEAVKMFKAVVDQNLKWIPPNER